MCSISLEMAYHPRIESRELTWLLTTRSQNSAMWFVNNVALEQEILGYAARYTERYKTVLYALAIEGNHCHAVMNFPGANRANFMRDLNSSIARAIPRHVKEFIGGRLWARRYSSEILPDPQDVERYFFYTVLQPVKDGLVERISDYPGYNCFHDAIYNLPRTFRVVDWQAYNAAKVRNPHILVKDHITTVTLRYERLPGYEKLSQKAYAKLMLKKLEDYRQEIINERRAKGLGFVGPSLIRKVLPGTLPRETKTSTRLSHRPRVLCICPVRGAELRAWYFTIVYEYRAASKLYRMGELSATFPEGTYRPPTYPGIAFRFVE